VEVRIATRTVVRVFVILAALVAFVALLYAVRSTVQLVFIAAFLAVALGPAVDFFARRRRFPRPAAILLVYVLIGLTIFGVGLLIVPPIVEQVQQLSNDIPGYLHDLRGNGRFRDYDDRYDITKQLNAQAATLPKRLGDAAGTLQAVTVGVFSAIFQLITVLTITFFMLLEGERLTALLLRLFGRGRENETRAIAERIYKSTSGYVAGALFITSVNGVLTFLVLSLLGVPFAVPLSVLMAFLGLIPLVGATIGGVIIALVTVFTGFPTDTIVWVVYIVVYQQVENSVLQPFVYKRTVNVPPLLVIVGILVGSSLLGVLGALVAIPVVAAIQTILRELFPRFFEDDGALREDKPDPTDVPPPVETATTA
jgi:predicted PurR-regulated permease PerM